MNVHVHVCVRISSCSALAALRQSSLYTHSPSLSTSKQLLRASQYPLKSLHGVPTGNRRPILPGNMLASCMFSVLGSPLLPLAMAMVERHWSPIMQHTSHTSFEEHSQLSVSSTTHNDPLHTWEGGGRGEGGGGRREGGGGRGASDQGMGTGEGTRTGVDSMEWSK